MLFAENTVLQVHLLLEPKTCYKSLYGWSHTPCCPKGRGEFKDCVLPPPVLFSFWVVVLLERDLELFREGFLVDGDLFSEGNGGVFKGDIFRRFVFEGVMPLLSKLTGERVNEGRGRVDAADEQAKAVERVGGRLGERWREGGRPGVSPSSFWFVFLFVQELACSEGFELCNYAQMTLLEKFYPSAYFTFQMDFWSPSYGLSVGGLIYRY